MYDSENQLLYHDDDDSNDDDDSSLPLIDMNSKNLYIFINLTYFISNFNFLK
jgi:hypothetical protein